jgi:hypothetical protein
MPYTPQTKPDSGPDLLSQVHIAVIRLDAKVDQIKDSQREQREQFQDHEARLRILENRPAVPVERFFALENRETVSPATLKWVVGVVVSVCGVIAGIIGLILR